MRYALIGLGNIGRKRLALLGKNCAVTVDPFQSDATCSDIRKVDLNSFDAAIISTPNDVKESTIRYLMEHSKPVLVDKPLVLGAITNYDELNLIAQKHNVLWHTSYNHRFEPLVVKLKSLLARGAIGELYNGRFFYGNGTALNSKGTWRDVPEAVFEDLGCHLLDLIRYFYSDQFVGFSVVTAQSMEMNGCDRGIFFSSDKKIEAEVSFLCWKNRFSIDLFGSEGSLHLYGLRKWGGARLELHRRVRPSGAPIVESYEDQGVDASWDEDRLAFEESINSGVWDKSRDKWIAEVLGSFKGAIAQRKSE